MVDPIAIAEKIIEIGFFIHETIDKVEAFKDVAEELMFRVKQITPALNVLKNMKGQKKELDAAQKREPKLAAFAQSLNDMLNLIEEVKTFTESLKGMSKFQQVRKKGKIEGEFKRLDRRLDILLESIQLGVLTDVRKEIETGQKENSVKILVKHVKSKSGDLSTGIDAKGNTFRLKKEASMTFFLKKKQKTKQKQTNNKQTNKNKTKQNIQNENKQTKQNIE